MILCQSSHVTELKFLYSFFSYHFQCSLGFILWGCPVSPGCLPLGFLPLTLISRSSQSSSFGSFKLVSVITPPVTWVCFMCIVLLSGSPSFCIGLASHSLPIVLLVFLGDMHEYSFFLGRTLTKDQRDRRVQVQLGEPVVRCSYFKSMVEEHEFLCSCITLA